MLSTISNSTFTLGNEPKETLACQLKHSEIDSLLERGKWTTSVLSGKLNTLTNSMNVNQQAALQLQESEYQGYKNGELEEELSKWLLISSANNANQTNHILTTKLPNNTQNNYNKTDLVSVTREPIQTQLKAQLIHGSSSNSSSSSSSCCNTSNKENKESEENGNKSTTHSNPNPNSNSNYNFSSSSASLKLAEEVEKTRQRLLALGIKVKSDRLTAASILANASILTNKKATVKPDETSTTVSDTMQTKSLSLSQDNISATTNNNDNRNINSKKDTNNTPLKTDERAIKDMKNEDLYQAGLTAAEKLKSQLETTLLLYQHIVERASSVTDSVNVQIWKNTRTQLEDTFAAVQNELKNPLQSKPQY